MGRPSSASHCARPSCAPARGLVEAPRGRVSRRPELDLGVARGAHRVLRDGQQRRRDALAPAVRVREHGRDVRAAGDRLEPPACPSGPLDDRLGEADEPDDAAAGLDRDARPPRAVGDPPAPALELAARAAAAPSRAAPSRGRSRRRRRSARRSRARRRGAAGRERQVARAGSSRQLGDRAQLGEPVRERPGHRGDHQRADARRRGTPRAARARRRAARRARPRRSARRAARPRPRPCGPRGRGPGPRARRPRTRSAGRAGCRSSACASPCRRRRARGSGASRRARPSRSSLT